MASPKQKIQRRLDMLPRLRGGGPVSYDYGQWVDVTVPVGQCAYRFVFYGGVTALLYASEACARKAARPKARTHPPYAAYTRFSQRAAEEERRLRKPAEWPPTSAITKIDVLRACRGFHEYTDYAPFVTLAGDFSAVVITAKMQAMVAAGLLQYDTNLSTARATRKGKRMLEAADAAERRTS
jgi:hypothetical protein